ncbi:hypothetical protein [Lactococcus allomyrinae]|uniref:LXG domain-containing protein n=1 Tax=Lactococcus allomyrinae TaxID=2419773 RepID=A0A387BJA1_9LACT|nr:hypothetical protein [Lactococcus allomyrinae]AYG01127.1 hypothetical protein D7I46_08490 [Lactococcus allomyrinae]
MVVYDSSDSDHLMQVMTANLKSAKEIFNRLSKGSTHLVDTINSGTLSGAAYTAGKELFVAYINPMLQKLSQAISDIESDLVAYRNADGNVRQYESHLDEVLIKQQLNNTKELIRLFQQKIDDDQDLMKNLQSAASGDFGQIAANMAEIPGLQEQLDNLEQVKTMHEHELAALETFVSSTSSLFTDSLQAFKYALQGVSIINQSRASFNGHITFPAGVNMSWITRLKNEKFDSKLSTKMGNRESGLLYPQYKNNPKAMTAMEKFLEAVAEGKSKSELNELYDNLVGFTKNKADLDELNGIVKDLQLTYPSGKLTLRTSRPKVMNNDDIETKTVSYTVNGIQQNFSETKNLSTGKLLSQSNGGLNNFMGVMDNLNGVGAGQPGYEASGLRESSDLKYSLDPKANIGEVKGVESIEPNDRLVYKEGAGANIALGAMAAEGEREDVQAAVNTTTVEKGSDYLAGQANNKKQTEATSKEAAKSAYNASHYQGSPYNNTPND